MPEREFFSSYCKPMKDSQLTVMRGNVVNNLPIAITIIIMWRVLPVQTQNFCMLWIFIDMISVVVSLEVPVYLSSQSYMADSSLSEEMSQFDFSTGVQSFSFSSQNPEGHRRTLVKRVSH